MEGKWTTYPSSSRAPNWQAERAPNWQAERAPNWQAERAPNRQAERAPNWQAESTELANRAYLNGQQRASKKVF